MASPWMSRKRLKARCRQSSSSSLSRPHWRATANNARGECSGLLDGPRVSAS
ncbi:Uncharacterised protein [Acinetobacter baumannii]|nr:Uncharacterised protein [Acinetobacter baumannii]